MLAGYQKIRKEYFQQKIRKGFEILRRCSLCPRNCGVDRLKGEKGFCGAGSKLSIASFNAHFGEEPPITGTGGSGTIFFSHCNLRCVFCQNYPISQLGNGRVSSIQRVAEMMISLQRRGCHNINLVTPTPYVPQVLAALYMAAQLGLEIPLVYNCGGYESIDALGLLEGIVDIYLPDMKYSDREVAKLLSSASDYPDANRKAIREMYRQVGEFRTNGNGIGVKGLIIRHLVLPNDQSGTEDILGFIARDISPYTHISLMGQYFPAHRAFEFPLISRKLSQTEYLVARRMLDKCHLTKGWVQEVHGASPD